MNVIVSSRNFQYKTFFPMIAFLKRNANAMLCIAMTIEQHSCEDSQKCQLISQLMDSAGLEPVASA